jgi:site-specific DNA recombinase
MKKRAILYIRVSTDEQADKGYSLNHQDERLRKYCELHKIEVAAIYQDDHSAKTFERPAFKQLLAYAKKNRAFVDFIFFINWSRFSRNAGDAYGMISQLNKLSIEPQAIEQPLDLSVPENKMMLAFYLAAPEVENDRRSLNVFSGMRRAKKEGRWVATAPKGYKNIRDENGRPLIVPSKDKELIMEAFEEVAKGIYTLEDVRKRLVRKGLICSKNNFCKLIRNPIYIGKIRIDAFKDEEMQIVNAIHEPIISESLFYKVQDILDGKKRNIPTKNTRQEELPLRGHLICKKCGNNLSGSASRGSSGGRYFYYHCAKGCNERFKAELANAALLKNFEMITARKEVMELYYEKVKEYFKANEKDVKKNISKIEDEIKKHQERINNAQQMMLDGELDSAEYKTIKIRYEALISDLSKEQINLELTETDYIKYLKRDFALLKNIDRYYTSAELEVKQKIISSIYPGKLIFENNAFRTNRISEVVKLISVTPSELETKKERLTITNDNQSSGVIPKRFERLTYCLEGSCSIQLSYGIISFYRIKSNS